MKGATNFQRMVTPSALGLILVLSSPAGTGCGDGADATDIEESNGTVTMVSYQPQDDGSVKSFAHVLPVADVRALQEARRARQEQRQAGIEVQQGALDYIGDTGNPFCADDRTTWLYSAPNGWTLPPNVYIACFGRAPLFQSSWTGSIDLTTLHLPDGTTWSSSVRSMWTSNTYRVGTESLWFALLYNLWETTNTGHPLLRMWHQL